MIRSRNYGNALQTVEPDIINDVMVPLSPISVSSVSTSRSFADDDECGKRKIPKELFISLDPISFSAEKSCSSIVSINSNEQQVSKSLRANSDHSRRYNVMLNSNPDNVNLTRSLHSYHVHRGRQLRRTSCSGSGPEDFDCHSLHRRRASLTPETRISTPGSQKEIVSVRITKSPMVSVYSADGRNESASRRRCSVVVPVATESNTSTKNIFRSFSMGYLAADSSASQGMNRRFSMTQRQNIPLDQMIPDIERPRRRFSLSGNDRRKKVGKVRSNSISFPASPNKKVKEKRRYSLTGMASERNRSVTATSCPTGTGEMAVVGNANIRRCSSLSRSSVATSSDLGDNVDAIHSAKTTRIVARLSMGHGSISSKYDRPITAGTTIENCDNSKSAGISTGIAKLPPRPCLKTSRSFRTETSIMRSSSLPYQLHRQNRMDAVEMRCTGNAKFSPSSIAKKVDISKSNPFLRSNAGMKNSGVQGFGPTADVGKVSFGITAQAKSVVVNDSIHPFAQTVPAMTTSFDDRQENCTMKPCEFGSHTRVSGLAHMRIARKISLSKSSNLRKVKSNGELATKIPLSRR